METGHQKLNKLSIVVSVFNEEETLISFIDETRNQLNNASFDYELIFVNDGSFDRSGELIEQMARKDPRVKVISFSRNFGHESAMLAGIDNATGDSVICMDSDLQHPPSKISAMVDAYYQGADIVNMICSERKDASWVKKITSRLFYKLINKISPV